MTAAFTFPGQGSQAVGMGKALAEAFPAARAVFDEVDSALDEKLTAIIWDGPGEALQLTENAQPALMAVSIATLRVLETEAIRSANIPRWPPPAASASAIPRACCVPAVLRCKKPCRSASGPWQHCSGLIMRPR